MVCKEFFSRSFATCDNRIIFIAEENKRKYILKNLSRQKICKIKIDNGFIQDDTRTKCDYAFLICRNNNLILVEIKGKNFIHAVEQIISTIELLAMKINENSVSARIVLTKVNVPNYKNTPKYIKLKKIIDAKNGNIDVKTKILEETI